MEHKPDLPYDYEDLGLGAQELEAKYSSGHPEYTIEAWKKIADTDSTHNGYWDWVIIQIEKDDEQY